MPYLWLKPEEAEIIIRRRRADIPEKTAYYDTNENAYMCDDCYLPLTEIKRLALISYEDYLPILQCSECGRTYFGLISSTKYEPEEERPAIKPEAPRKEQEKQSPKQEEEYIILPSIMTV